VTLLYTESKMADKNGRILHYDQYLRQNIYYGSKTLINRNTLHKFYYLEIMKRSGNVKFDEVPYQKSQLLETRSIPPTRYK